MRRPRPPKALHEFRELQERWGQVDDWCDNETNAAYRYRSFALHRSMHIDDLNVRCSVHFMVCQRHADHLTVIDRVHEAYHDAYLMAHRALDSDALLSYAVKIIPSVQEEMKIESKRRLDALLKSKGITIDGGTDAGGRDERVPEGDQQEEAADEGAGG